MNCSVQYTSERSRLGQLFIASGIIDYTVLSSSLLVCHKADIPLGRVLSMSGYVNEHELDAALELQQMLRRGAISVELAQLTLREVQISKLTVAQILQNLGWKKPKRLPLKQLSILLLSAKIVPRDALDQAMEKSLASNMSVGRALIISGSISPSILCAAVDIQILIRDKKISAHMGVAILEAVYLHRVSLPEALGEFGLALTINGTNTRLGDLLAAAGIISELDAVTAAEIGVDTHTRVGEVLIDSFLITAKIAEVALKFQAMIENDSITRDRAIDLLKRFSRYLNVSIEDIIAELDRSARPVNLFLEAPIVSDQKISEATNAQATQAIQYVITYNGALEASQSNSAAN